jgi:hypothetical protein
MIHIVLHQQKHIILLTHTMCKICFKLSRDFILQLRVMKTIVALSRGYSWRFIH